MSIKPEARYIMLGGFLGAGKTTSVLQLARYFDSKGLTVGLITNDQGERLVDTAMLASNGFSVEEIAGGCFCCRFHSLQDAAENLTLDTSPDVFIAEAVGSCTDLVATVSYPLRRIYGDRFSIAPLTVVIDPRRALRIFGLETGKSFSSKVLYIYKKQLEESQIILMNKCDTIDVEQRTALESTLRAEYPEAKVITCSARDGDGLSVWFDYLQNNDMNFGRVMDVDYETYGSGEARLGWLNAAIHLASNDWIDGNELLKKFTQQVQTSLKLNDLEIAHLKMTLAPEDETGGLAIVNLVGSDFDAEASQTLMDDVERGEIIVNIRAEAPPETLEKVLRDAVAACTDEITTLHLEHLERFAPGQPVPVYREGIGA